MTIITLMPFSWKGNTHIRIGFEKNTVVADYVGNFPGVQWNKENVFFYVLYTKTITHVLFDHFRARKYYVDYSQIIPPTTNAVKKGHPKIQEATQPIAAESGAL